MSTMITQSRITCSVLDIDEVELIRAPVILEDRCSAVIHRDQIIPGQYLVSRVSVMAVERRINSGFMRKCRITLTGYGRWLIAMATAYQLIFR